MIFLSAVNEHQEVCKKETIWNIHTVYLNEFPHLLHILYGLAQSSKGSNHYEHNNNQTFL
jgi:hypothetical protein